MKPLAGAAVLFFGAMTPAAAQTVDLNSLIPAGGASASGRIIEMVALLTVLSIAPGLLIMVTSTTILPMSKMTPEIPMENFLNCASVSILPFTTRCMAITFAAGSAFDIWLTMSLMGQSLQSAATSAIEIRPSLFKMA